MNKLCNVIMLPINDKSNLFLSDDMLFISDNSYTEGINKIVTKRESFQHLYIVSNEEIKEGDWCIIKDEPQQVKSFNASVLPELKDKYGNTLCTCYNIQIGHHEYFPESLIGKKIIASTDPLLKLPQIPQSFITLYIEEYNADRKIERVEVEYEPEDEDWDEEIGAIIHPEQLKINSKENTISIKPIKDSWNREEVIELLEKFNDEKCIFPKNIMNKWIKENL